MIPNIVTFIILCWIHFDRLYQQTRSHISKWVLIELNYVNDIKHMSIVSMCFHGNIEYHSNGTCVC